VAEREAQRIRVQDIFVSEYNAEMKWDKEVWRCKGDVIGALV
jgi:hypothetical protein